MEHEKAVAMVGTTGYPSGPLMVDATAPVPPSGGTKPIPVAKRWLLWVAVVLAVASLCLPITASGIWDPHELKIADLSRRIAHTLLGGEALALEGANNQVPTLGELARGQLPFTSVALGFRVFGLHEWAGRLPLALWGLVGLAAVYALLARLSDWRTGAFGVLTLATTPLYFVHARTILGDIVTMAAAALAVAGLGIACFDRADPGESAGARRKRRWAWLFVGFLGLAAGFGARGLLVGVAVPALGVGSAWLIARAASADADDGLAAWVGALCLIVGASCLWVGLRALLQTAAKPTEFSMLIGAALDKPRQLPTFDFVVQHLGHGLIPYGAVIPFAAGRMLAVPPVAAGAAQTREAGLRLMLLCVAALGFGAYGLMAPVTGHLAYGPVFALVAMVAIFLRDFERGAGGSRTLAMGVAALAILLYTDFKNFPDKGMSPFAVSETRFPESFKEDATRLIKYSTLGMIGVFFASIMERQADAARRFVRDEYLEWPRRLRSQFGGNLLFAFLVAEAALAGSALLAYLSARYFHWKQFAVMGALTRQVVEYGWIVLPIAVLVAPAAALLARDVCRWFYARAGVTRAVGALAGIVVAGATLSFRYYPALAAQMSPKDVFEAYRELAKSGEKLGMMGVGAGSASYYAGRDVPTFSNTITAFGWLMEAPERRWLVIRANDLPQMSSMYRSRVTPPRNLPVLDARSSEILLVSNRLEPGEQNKNPFDSWILTEAPNPSRRVDGSFGGQLDAVGWDVLTLDGKVAPAVEPGKRYQFVIYYKVAAQISGNWETFVHIDGFQRRFNGDHKTLEGKYPFHLWRVGDYIADYYEFTLEPNFTPGTYRVYYGLFMGNRRLEVKRGRHHEDRLEAGSIEVR